MERWHVPAESPFAATVGYSRAVRVGHHVHVSGTAPIMPDGADPPPGPYGQAKRCLQIIAGALLEVGATPADVVRTRIFLTAPEHWEEVGRAHGELFGEVQPASAMVVVASLLDPRWLVEIEADALIA
jgi:enamine deaminase RidA (YjgF/YER057c/UK114 family)